MTFCNLSQGFNRLAKWLSLLTNGINDGWDLLGVTLSECRSYVFAEVVNWEEMKAVGKERQIWDWTYTLNCV